MVKRAIVDAWIKQLQRRWGALSEADREWLAAKIGETELAIANQINVPESLTGRIIEIYSQFLNREDVQGPLERMGLSVREVVQAFRRQQRYIRSFQVPEGVEIREGDAVAFFMTPNGVQSVSGSGEVRMIGCGIGQPAPDAFEEAARQIATTHNEPANYSNIPESTLTFESIREARARLFADRDENIRLDNVTVHGIPLPPDIYEQIEPYRAGESAVETMNRQMRQLIEILSRQAQTPAYLQSNTRWTLRNPHRWDGAHEPEHHDDPPDTPLEEWNAKVDALLEEMRGQDG